MESDVPVILTSIGDSPSNKESLSKALGSAQYVDDLPFHDLAYAALLLSPHARARVVNIDAREALQMEGVLAVVHCFNTPARRYNSAIRFYSDDSPCDMPKTERIFDTEVRFVGDRVAAVAALTEEIARKAAQLISVEYEVLAPVITLEEAVAKNAPLATDFGVDGTNICGGAVAYGNDTEESVLRQVRTQEIVHESHFHAARVHHGYIEPVTHVAAYDDEGVLTVWTPSQSVFSFRDVLSYVFDLPQSQVHVVKTIPGGAFGGKLEVMHEPVVAALAMQLHRPVKLRLNRKETFAASRSRHEALLTISSGFRVNGILVSQHVKSLLNTGAYAGSGPNTVGAQSGKTFVQYRAESLFYHGCPIYTNSPIAGAMRGYGCPQIMVAREVHMDQVAHRLGLDPVELRMANLLEPHEKNVLGKDMHVFLAKECLVKGTEMFGWEQKRRAAEADRSGSRRIGVGMACAVHGSGWYGVYQDMTAVTMLMNNDGSVQVLAGIHDLGTGARTILMQITAQALGLPLQMVALHDVDTRCSPVDLGAQASRSTYIGGSCVLKAAKDIQRQLHEVAAVLLEVPQEELSLLSGCVVHQDSGRSIPFGRLVDAAQKGVGGSQRQIATVQSFASEMAVYSSSAVFVQVCVDTDSGEVEVRQVLSVHHSGTPINPALCEAQVHGGIHMGLGYALSEQMETDPNTGALKNPSFRSYRMFRSNRMPRIGVYFIKTPEESGPYGAKGLGEIATDGVAPAVVNAVSHALGNLMIDRIPLTPKTVLRMIGKIT